MKVQTGEFKFVTKIKGIQQDILSQASNIFNDNWEIVYGIQYDIHASRYYKKPIHICDGMEYWTDAIEPEYADVKTGFMIQVHHERSGNTWAKSSISIFPIEEGIVKREKPVVQFEQTKDFEILFHTPYINKSSEWVASAWVCKTMRCPVVQYVVGETSFSDIVEKYTVYSDIPWDGMTTLFSMITEEQRKQLISEHTDEVNRWHVADIVYQIELFANADMMNNLHDYEEFKRKFKREDILAAIRDCNQKGYHELQVFLNHCVSQETEDDWRKRWEL